MHAGTAFPRPDFPGQVCAMPRPHVHRLTPLLDEHHRARHHPGLTTQQLQALAQASIQARSPAGLMHQLPSARRAADRHSLTLSAPEFGASSRSEAVRPDATLSTSPRTSPGMSQSVLCNQATDRRLFALARHARCAMAHAPIARLAAEPATTGVAPSSLRSSPPGAHDDDHQVHGHLPHTAEYSWHWRHWPCGRRCADRPGFWSKYDRGAD